MLVEEILLLVDEMSISRRDSECDSSENGWVAALMRLDTLKIGYRSRGAEKQMENIYARDTNLPRKVYRLSKL